MLSPALVAALATGLVAVIGAAAGAAQKILQELRVTKTLVAQAQAVIVQTKDTVEANAVHGQRAGTMRDKKLDNITLLVDGRYGEVLQELADVRQLFATLTGQPGDQARAAAAQAAATAQIARVAVAAREALLPPQDPPESPPE